MSDEFIQSRQNPRVKLLDRLRDRAGRRKTGFFAVEGLRELSRCVETVGADEIIFAPTFSKAASIRRLSKNCGPTPKFRSAGCRRARSKKSRTARAATALSAS